MAVELDHYYVFGDVYETLDTCQELESMLSRLRRQDLLSDADWMHSKRHIAEIRGHLERTLPGAD